MTAPARQLIFDSKIDPQAVTFFHVLRMTCEDQMIVREGVNENLPVGYFSELVVAF